MKKLSIICSLIIVFGLMLAPAFATNDYDVDYLECGNPGGPEPVAGNKTWDSGGILVTEGDTFSVDVWMDRKRTPFESSTHHYNLCVFHTIQ